MGDGVSPGLDGSDQSASKRNANGLEGNPREFKSEERKDDAKDAR